MEAPRAHSGIAGAWAIVRVLSRGCSFSSTSGPSLQPREKRRRLSEAHELRQLVEAATRVANHLASTTLHPSAGPSATDRMAALRSRVRARAAADAAWDEERRVAGRLAEH